MIVVSELKNAVNASDINAQYDEKAKRLLSNKIILAHIMVKTIDEFRGMDPKEVVQHIEGDPFVGTVPIEPGLLLFKAQFNSRIFDWFWSKIRVRQRQFVLFLHKLCASQCRMALLVTGTAKP